MISLDLSALLSDAPIPLPPTEPWERHAACRTAGVNFYPATRSGVALCRSVCERCPVLDDCADFAVNRLPRRSGGVWAGMTERERLGVTRTIPGKRYVGLAT